MHAITCLICGWHVHEDDIATLIQTFALHQILAHFGGAGAARALPSGRTGITYDELADAHEVLQRSTRLADLFTKGEVV